MLRTASKTFSTGWSFRDKKDKTEFITASSQIFDDSLLKSLVWMSTVHYLQVTANTQLILVQFSEYKSEA
jgi:hypothetical protein